MNHQAEIEGINSLQEWGESAMLARTPVMISRMISDQVQTD